MGECSMKKIQNKNVNIAHTRKISKSIETK